MVMFDCTLMSACLSMHMNVGVKKGNVTGKETYKLLRMCGVVCLFWKILRFLETKLAG